MRTEYEHICRTFYNNGNLASIEYENDNGELHCKDGWAVQSYFDDGQLSYEAYAIDGHLHREGAPAVTHYNRNGSIMHQRYYKNGKVHREDDGPAYSSYNDDGSRRFAKWVVNGKTHRENGPAVIKQISGRGVVAQYFIDDKLLTLEQFEKRKKELTEPTCDDRIVPTDKTENQMYILKPENLQALLRKYEDGGGMCSLEELTALYDFYNDFNGRYKTIVQATGRMTQLGLTIDAKLDDIDWFLNDRKINGVPDWATTTVDLT